MLLGSDDSFDLQDNFNQDEVIMRIGDATNSTDVEMNGEPVEGPAIQQLDTDKYLMADHYISAQRIILMSGSRLH